MTRPPTAPDARIGAIAFVMIASGRLSRMPRTNPTAQPGRGSRILQITNPRPKRAMNAPSMAARLSGKLRGIIKAVSMVPKMSPQRMPREIRDIWVSSAWHLTPYLPEKHLGQQFAPRMAICGFVRKREVNSRLVVRTQSKQHLREVYSQESRNLIFFAGADSDAARSCPIRIVSNRKGRFSSAGIVAASGWCFRLFLAAEGCADHRSTLTQALAGRFRPPLSIKANPIR
jgi:hypothetical protein